MKKFASRLKELREKKGISALALSKILKFADTNIGRWERGKNGIKLGSIIKLADYFNVSIDYLLGRSDDY